MPTVGEILYLPAQIVTVEADTGGVTKGDPVKITAASVKAGIYIKVKPLAAVTDIPIGVAMDNILEGKLGPIVISSPVVFMTGKSTVTIGAWVGYGAVSQVSDIPNTEGAVAFRGCVGIAWKGVASSTAVIPVQLMPCVFATYVS